jgi:type I restriction enzyme, S subunit
MSSDWSQVSFEQVKAIGKSAFAMGPFGSNIKAENFTTSGVPVIKGGNLNGTYIDDNFTDFLTEEKATELASSQARHLDIVITHRGTLGQVGLIPENAKYPYYVVSQSQLKLSFDQAKVDPYFVYYFLRSPLGQQRLLANTSQVGVPAIAQALTTIRQIQISLPSLTAQHGICSILRSIDDRITLLRETNATLEAIAQALFKSWFVDFDPVRAKMEGRAPEAMDDATAALFPDSFEESELGLVPMGWRVATLADTFDINPTRKLSKGSMASYLDMASLATIGHCVEAPIDREMGSGAKFQNGDTLLARITPCLENGKSAFVDFLAEGEIGWGSTEFLVLRPKAPLPQYLGYLLCRHPAFREYAIQSMSGTSGRQRIQNDVLGRYLLAVPDVEIALVFADVIGPIQRSIAANHQSAQTLATLRDTLLPRLISGQLRLSETLAEMD